MDTLVFNTSPTKYHVSFVTKPRLNRELSVGLKRRNMACLNMEGTASSAGQEPPGPRDLLARALSAGHQQ